jgi:CheY-like chemotaxis protein
MREPWSGSLWGWVLAIVGPAAAVGLGLVLVPVLGPQVLGPFFLAVAVASLVGGLGPGLFAVLGSAVAANYWFFPPDESLGFASESDLVVQILFWAVAVLVAALCAWSRARRLRAENEAEGLSAEMEALRARLMASATPALAPAARPARAESRPKVQRPVRDQPTALVATDDAEARQLACHALESVGFRWLSACDATEALELVDRYDFSVELAVIDVLLPDMRGESLAERLIGRYANIGVLYASNVPHDELVSRGLLPAHAPLLSQPFTADQLLAAVREYTPDRAEPQEVLAASSGDR